MLKSAPFIMSITFYILLFSNLIFFTISQFFPELFFEYQTPVALLLIALIGIPHGAVDHLLFLKKTNRNKTYFYSFYITLLVIYGISWIYFPMISLSLFLILSAYHFGQSQFEKYEVHALIKKVIGFTWGVVILSGLVVFNFKEIQLVLTDYDELNAFVHLFNFEFFKLTCSLSTVLFILISLFSLNFVSFVKELIYISLIGITFLIQPLLLGFALFFIFNHSYTVMRSEYNFLSKYDSHFNLSKFIKALTPFTLLSILGTSFLYYLSTVGWISISLPFILLITISSLTFPHAIVMEVFYTKR